MKDNLSLSKINAFTINSEDDDKRSSNKGCYKDYNIASINAKNCGWFGSNGSVEKMEVWQDEDELLYTLTPIGHFTDAIESYRNDVIDNIKAKLTDAEIKLLGI